MAWIIAIGSIIAGGLAAYGSQSAAQTQANSAGNAMNTTVAQGIQNQLNLGPYQAAGGLALGDLLKGFGLGNPNANPSNPSNLPLNPRTGQPYTMSDFLGYDLSQNPNNPANAQRDAQTQFSEYLSGNIAALGGPKGAVWGGNPPIMPNQPTLGGGQAPATSPATGATAATNRAATPFGNITAGLAGPNGQPIAAQGPSGGFGGLIAPFNMQDFLNDPGYQFQLQQGQQAINQGAAARGNFYSPGTLQSLDQFTTGLASQDYNTAFGQYWTQNQNIISSLMGLAGLGTGETNVGVQAGNSQSNALAGLMTSQGAAQAGGTMGMYNALGGTSNSLVNNYLLSQLVNNQQQPQYNASVNGYIGPYGYNPQPE